MKTSTIVDKAGVKISINSDGSLDLGIDDWLTISFSGPVSSTHMLTIKKNIFFSFKKPEKRLLSF